MGMGPCSVAIKVFPDRQPTGPRIKDIKELDCTKLVTLGTMEKVLILALRLNQPLTRY